MDIDESFQQFINSYKTNEEEKFNYFVQNIIELNFNNSIINILNLFGNDFFERIIKYNENYKIKNFYQFIKYYLLQNVITLFNNNNINILPKDLIDRINDINSLNSLLDNYNENILKIFAQKIEDFIDESKQKIINKYLNYIKDNVIIEFKQNEKIYLLLKDNVDKVKPELESYYLSLLNNDFKEKSYLFYSNLLKELKNEIINYEKENKKLLILQTDNVFSLLHDNILNEINIKINDVSNSIKEYNIHFNKFKICDDLILFLNNFGYSKVQPSYESIINLLNNITKDNIVPDFDNNSKIYKNSFNFESFNKSLNNKYILLNNDFENAKKNIYSYGISEYPNNLQREIYKIEERLRNLENEELKGEKDNKNKYNIADKAINENFQNILNISENIIEFITNYEEYNNFEEIIFKNIKKFNLAYNISQKRINENKYKEDINITLNDKLLELKNLGLEYYNKINNSFYIFKNYLNDSIYEINSLLYQCTYITNKTLYKMYEEISNETESFEREENKIDEESQKISHISNYQNVYYITDIEIIELIKKARFKFNFELEDGMPKLKVSLTNQNVPKKIIFSIYTGFGTCGKNVQNIEVQFNNINFTTNIEYNTESTNLSVSTITDFDSYQYSIETYKIEDISEIKCVSIMYIDFCFNVGKCTNSPVNRNIILKTETQKYTINNYSLEI